MAAGGIRLFDLLVSVDWLIVAGLFACSSLGCWLVVVGRVVGWLVG